MSLRLKLILALAGAFTAGFVTLGFAALRITQAAIEKEASRRIDRTLEAIERHPRFFIAEAAFNREQFEQVSAISGFHIVVPERDGRTLRGSSLPVIDAEAFLAGRQYRQRWAVTISGVEYLAARAESGGRSFYLLSPLGAAQRVEEETRGPLLLVSILGLVVAIILAVVLAAGVSRPIRRLARRVAEVREGSLDVEIPEGGGREVKELAGSFRDMLSGLSGYRKELVKKEKLAALGRFSASVAHELRNPLSSISMSLELLRDGVNEASRGDIDLLLSEIARLDHSVDELLFHAGTPRYVFEGVDLGTVVQETLAVVSHLARHLEVDLTHTGPEAPVLVRGDGAKLKQALTNLVLNGLYACGSGGAVRVSISQSAGRATVSVRDTGPGPKEELRDSIFEPFVSCREGGTGLGLTVTRAIARAHQGDVVLDEQQSETTFRLWIPGSTEER